MKIDTRCEIDRRSRSYIHLVWNDGQQHEGHSNSIVYHAVSDDDDEWSESSTFSNDDNDLSIHSINLILDAADLEEFETYPFMLNPDDSDNLEQLIKRSLFGSFPQQKL